MRRLFLWLAFAAVAHSLGACTSPEPPSDAGDVTSVAHEDSTEATVLAVARLESEPENHLELSLTYPQLNPSAMPELSGVVDAINRDIASRIATEVDSFLVWAREAGRSQPDGMEGGFSFMEGEFGSAHLSGRLFSVPQEISMFLLGSAHPNSTTIVFNYDLGRGRQIGLADVFNGATAYLDSLSSRAAPLLADEARERGFEIDGLMAEGFGPLAENFDRFTLGADSLTLYFPPSAVAPYAAGPFTISMSYADLRPLLAETGPASGLGAQQ